MFVGYLSINFFSLSLFLALKKKKKMARGYEIFQKFEKEEYIHKEDLKYMNDYICGNLNSDYCPNYKYW